LKCCIFFDRSKSLAQGPNKTKKDKGVGGMDDDRSKSLSTPSSSRSVSVSPSPEEVLGPTQGEGSSKAVVPAKTGRNVKKARRRPVVELEMDSSEIKLTSKKRQTKAEKATATSSKKVNG
jgi:hypothetical protein